MNLVCLYKGHIAFIAIPGMVQSYNFCRRCGENLKAARLPPEMAAWGGVTGPSNFHFESDASES